MYHQNKWKFFKDKDIPLIQIFENEWVNKEDIVKSIILNKLGKSKEVIYARKCEIKEVDNKDTNKFLISNHLQDTCVSRIRIGLYYNNELAALATFGKNRFSKDDTYELLRYCNKINTNIVGGYNKLLSHFIKNYSNNIISYVDLRYFNASAYINFGFKIIDITSPNYFYFKNNSYILYNRINFQKHKLKDKLDVFDPLLSEIDNMRNNGYNRIFDAGNYKMIKN